MVLPVLKLSPLIEGYTFEQGSSVMSIKLEGGLSRYRMDKIGASAQVNVRFILTKQQYNYFEAFYNTKIAMGSLPFEIGLISENSEIRTHKCFFVEGTKKLTKTIGDVFWISCTLEAEPIARDVDYDNTLIMIFEEYGEEGDNFINLLEELTNVTMPETLGAE
jgi:hypothetical protein